MKGVVEIFIGDSLLLREDNLIVDKAGEMIADLMTIPPDISSIPSASALLDASNFTVQAISFSKAASSFSVNGHTGAGIPRVGRVNGEVWVVTTSSNVSSYIPNPYLPQYASPEDIKLETFNNFTGVVSSFNTFGQNLNLLNYGFQVCSFDPSVAIRFGCYPPASGIQAEIRLDDGTASGVLISSTKTPTSRILTGSFNAASSMDWQGFVKKIPGTSTTSGLVVSSNINFSSTGEVIYSITISSGDSGCANLFGGIYSIGLWGLDLESMLCVGRTPPYSFNPLVPFNYRLFAKKVLSDNIVRVFDVGSNAGLRNPQAVTINWRLYFL